MTALVIPARAARGQTTVGFFLPKPDHACLGGGVGHDVDAFAVSNACRAGRGMGPWPGRFVGL